MVKLTNQHLAEGPVVAALDNAVMEIQVSLSLEIGGVLLQVLLLLMLGQHVIEAVDFLSGHLLSGQPRRHAFQCFAHMVDFDEIVEAQRGNTGAHMDNTF